MPAAAAAPGRLLAPPGALLAEEPGLAEDPWWTEDPEPPAAWLTEDQALTEGQWLTDDPWLAEGPWLAEDPWLAEGPECVEDPEWAEDQASSRRPGPVEVFKAGRWDRSRGDGGGFAAGGAADDLPPGPVLAGLAGDRWADGLGRLSDDELIGVLRAARRLTSWGAAMELAALGDLWRRRLAEEEAGDTGAAEFASDEVAAALTLTKHAADQALGLAVTMGRLPRTGAALAAGDIDLPRAKVIADETAGLTSEHAAAVEDAVIGAAAKRTTGQLRAAAHRAVLAADPDAARERKEEALREARVERSTEPAGTAALAGRDLPPAAVLAADANLTALARQLKAAGVPGTMDALRAEIYLALLTGVPVAGLLSAVTSRVGLGCPGSGGPGGSGSQGSGSGSGGSGSKGSGGGPGGGGPGGGGSGGGGSGGGGSGGGGSGGSGCGAVSRDGGGGPGGVTGPCTGPASSPVGAEPPGLRRPASPGAFPAFTGLMAGSVNLTMPLATWLGLDDAPGQAAGFGPLDATDSRALADALAARAETKWCLTVIGPDGHPVAHGCARAGPSPGRRRKRRATGTGDRPAAGSRDGPGSRARDRTWTITITPLDQGACDHAWETPAYEPTSGLRHLVRIRHVTCTFPGCRRPAAQCDADHTLAYDSGGRTCLCNLAPLCRHHHQVKQSPRWALDHTRPGVLVWQTPSGRTYTITPTEYPV